RPGAGLPRAARRGPAAATPVALRARPTGRPAQGEDRRRPGRGTCARPPHGSRDGPETPGTPRRAGPGGAGLGGPRLRPGTAGVGLGRAPDRSGGVDVRHAPSIGVEPRPRTVADGPDGLSRRTRPRCGTAAGLGPELGLPGG